MSSDKEQTIEAQKKAIEMLVVELATVLDPRTASLRRWYSFAKDMAVEPEYFISARSFDQIERMRHRVIRRAFAFLAERYAHFDALVGPWESAIGTEWTRETTDE